MVKKKPVNRDRSGNKTHKLSGTQKSMLRGWFVEGLSSRGIRSRIELYNQQAAQVGADPFPELHMDTLGYWRNKMAPEVNQIISDHYAAEEMMIRASLRTKDERIKRLEWCAEQLEPYLGQASVKGVFSAAETYCQILEQIRGEVEPNGVPLHGVEPVSIRNMPIEQVKELAEKFRQNGSVGRES